MELTKYKKNEVTPHIRHDIRDLAEGKSYHNESINRDLSSNNYSLINRGQTVREINEYRKKIEEECFQYARKDLVHAIEIAIQCPSDCPIDQHEAFFQEAHNYICSKLPMGEKCVFVSEVHRDEQCFSPTGELISKEHLHIMFVPAVRITKHNSQNESYEYKLCADELTRKKKMKELHPGLQAHLDTCGIQATVVNKKNDNERNIPLSVRDLKELTKATGIVLDKAITIDDLIKIVNRNIELNIENKELKALIDREQNRWNINRDIDHERSRWV